jgi:hypothetical protein
MESSKTTSLETEEKTTIVTHHQTMVIQMVTSKDMANTPATITRTRDSKGLSQTLTTTTITLSNVVARVAYPKDVL